LQFVAYLDAYFADNDDLAEYYPSTLMRPEMSEAVKWWDATDEAITPFDEDDDNPYEISEWDEADQLQSDADALAEEGVEADKQSDVFELATVFFALTLFFGGVATLFAKKPVTSALLVMSVIALSLGAVNLVGA
jgi:hypothetical protein